MGSQRPLISSLSGLLLMLSFLILLTGQQVVESSSNHRKHGHHHHHHMHGTKRAVSGFQPEKLFVFGDSYADTGNTKKANSSSWRVPYGITFPGKPSGRFTSGRLLTDFLAKTFGLKSPVPYQWRNLGAHYLVYGMNFAYGGTGVFNTLVSYPNMTTQIDLFERLIEANNFTAADVSSSLTLVTVSGNDYSAYLAKGGTLNGLPAFIKNVVDQLRVNLRRIYNMGARKVAVADIQPLGCLPAFTAPSSFQKCNDTVNTLSGLHNQLLRQAVADLNNQTGSSTFVVVDLNTAFLSVINATAGDSKFKTPLVPCCVGMSSSFSCGSMDANGTKKYTLCEDPESAFFWDTVHPTQAGWSAVYQRLASTLQQL